MNLKRKSLTLEQALSRCAELCSRCEQCTPDLRAKMLKWGLTMRDADKAISELERLRFVDDARFARAYAHDKLRFSGWGRRKITAGLWAKKLPRDIIAQSMDDIEAEEYEDVARHVISSKIKSLKECNLDYETKMKVVRHVMQRGFEGSLAVRLLHEAIESMDE